MGRRRKHWKLEGLGLTKKEKKWAKKRYKEYQKYNEKLDNFNDTTILEELVFREALHRRFKKQFQIQGENEEYTVSKTQLTAMNSNFNQIIKLRNKLGLDNKDEKTKPLKYIESVDKKFKKWRETHWSERKATCPFCGMPFFLKQDISKLDAVASPFFAKDRVIANKPLYKLYVKGKISKEDVAEVTNVSLEYVDKLAERFKKEKAKDDSKN